MWYRTEQARLEEGALAVRHNQPHGGKLNRALGGLGHLQRLRKGEYVPAPPTVSLEGPLNGNGEN